MSELTKPNAFVFKAFIDNEYKLCVCPRINNNVNAQYIKSDKAIASDMYANNSFFSTIEKGYQHFYEQSITSEREGIVSQTSEQENL